MGLGGGPQPADEYEWVDLAAWSAPATTRGLATVPERTASARGRAPSTPGVRRRVPAVGGPAAGAEGLAEALCAVLTVRPLWLDVPGVRVLCVDLDNLRAGPTRWRARMAAVVVLARQADRVHLAGQHVAVERARPHLEEFADVAVGVADGSDVADHVLLDAAAADAAQALAEGRGLQVLAVSNDGIFAGLAEHGPLVVLSPGVEALSDRLEDAASDILDLAALEADVVATVP